MCRECDHLVGSLLHADECLPQSWVAAASIAVSATAAANHLLTLTHPRPGRRAVNSVGPLLDADAHPSGKTSDGRKRHMSHKLSWGAAALITTSFLGAPDMAAAVPCATTLDVAMVSG